MCIRDRKLWSSCVLSHRGRGGPRSQAAMATRLSRFPMWLRPKARGHRRSGRGRPLRRAA
eukprot:12261825-Alexandrium_andersonii.AAC.1